MTKDEAISRAQELGRQGRGHLRYFVIGVSSTDYEVWDQRKTEVALSSSYISQRHIEYVTDGN